MKRSNKILLITVAALILTGAVMSLIACALVGFDLKGFSNEEFTETRREVSGDFDKITVKGIMLDVYLTRGETEACEVIWDESESIKHEITVEGGELKIKCVDERRWFEHIGFFYMSDLGIEIRLPKDGYGELTVETASAEVKVDGELSFEGVSISTASGEVNVSDVSASSFRVKTSSGDVEIYSAAVSGRTEITTASGGITLSKCALEELVTKSSSGDAKIKDSEASSIKMKSSSGEVRLSGVNADGLGIETVSGEITLGDVSAEGRMEIESSSGEVSGLRVSAGELDVKTVSGDVTLSVSSAMTFDCDSTSGDVKVPSSSQGGGRCRIRSSSGRITVTSSK